MQIGRGSKAVIMLAALVVLFAGIKLAKPLLVPLLLAAFLATMTSPLILWLRDRKIPGSVAVALGVIIDVGVITGLSLLISQSLAGLDERLPEYQKGLELWIAQATSSLERYGISQEQVVETLSPGSMVDSVGTLIENVAGLLSTIVLVLIVVVFMQFEALGLNDKLGRVIEPDRLEDLRRATHEVNKYLAVKTATSALTGALCGAWAGVVGVDFPVLWGIFAFFLNYIPTIGSIIATIPPTLLALIHLGPGGALAVLSGYLAINFTIGNFLEPRVFGRTLGLSPLIVFVSMILWGWLLGPVGALLAVPLTMLAKIMMYNTEDLRWAALLLGPAGEARREAREEALRTSLAPPPPAPAADEHGNGGERSTAGSPSDTGEVAPGE
jgi:predicted PurR-regulated permease PerM